ncbi:putative nucleotide sugar transporter [Trypanosoma theileri]|uniref:Putative nucleotide sugar transporter n=1 Tax=Trypanosoma theileri TaxID=67003 RepID=A0A1X0NTU7_9TRYP|nr:putative nucleotide sugar transporter [Trypanosoma theileri]ORC88147.1 putative nucleotide sugar transporter [Trypanosoma theileri]
MSLLYTTHVPIEVHELDGKKNEDPQEEVVAITPTGTPPASATAGALTPVENSQSFGISLSLILSSMYIGTSIALFLTIRYSKKLEREGFLSYNSTGIVMAIEITKIMVSVALKYAEDGDFLFYSVTFGRERRELWRMSMVYVIPALLYALYNNLTYINLHYFDPGTVQMFMQTRVLFTGFLFATVLQRALSLRQWISLGILTIGLIVKYISPTLMMLMNVRVLAILLQAFFSSLAGVYNELALKREAYLSIHQQNFFMYLYGILFNLLLGLLVAPQEYMQLHLLYHPHIIFIPIIFMGALNGLTAAFILKFINVIVKAFASAVEVVLMAVVASLVLDESFTQQDFVAAVFVMVSVYLYYTKGCGSERVEKQKRKIRRMV